MGHPATDPKIRQFNQTWSVRKLTSKEIKDTDFLVCFIALQFCPRANVNFNGKTTLPDYFYE